LANRKSLRLAAAILSMVEADFALSPSQRIATAVKNFAGKAARRLFYAFGSAVAPFQARRRRRHGLSPPMTRAAFLQQITGRPALEIGPFDTPQLHGDGVAYFDVLDQEGLRSRAKDLGRNPAACPPIDFVSPTGDLGTVDRRFRSIFSSHAIEHQPDLIRHLKEVERLLEPGGCYYVIVPDKRYSFDHFLPVTEAQSVEEAHREKRRVHTASAISDHYLKTTHNSPMRHWLGLHGQSRRTDPESIERTAAGCEQAARGEYVDVHAWIFTPESFFDLMRHLHATSATALEVSHVYDTMFGRIEFFAVLRKAREPAGADGDAPTGL
jgi:SAM-dependent methyltransferase